MRLYLLEFSSRVRVRVKVRISGYAHVLLSFCNCHTAVQKKQEDIISWH